MCRLLGFSTEKKVEQKQLEDIIYTCRELLKDQRDGFGYALSGGDVSGIASLRLTSGTMYGYNYEPAGEWRDFVNVPYEKRGEVAPCTAALFHGRTSTNHIKIQNSHPVVNENLALAHNGIVEYSGKKRRKAGTCDSEDLFNTFSVGKGWRELSKYYSGYAAVLIIKPGGTLVIYRDATPTLYMCKVGGGVVVGTSMMDVTTLAKKFDGIPSAPWSVLPDVAFTANNGHVTGHEKVKPMPRRTYGAQDQLSLGFSPTHSPAATEKKESSPFPDYAPTRSQVYYEGEESGYEDAMAGYSIKTFGDDTDPDFVRGYTDGYEDGKTETARYLGV